MRGQPVLVTLVLLVVAGIAGLAIAGLPQSAPDEGLDVSVGTTSSSALVTTTTAASLRPPPAVRVLVVNATGRAGVASSLTEQFDGLGYTTLTPANLAARQRSVVHYRTGFQPEAEAVMALVPVTGGGGVLLEPLADPPPVAGAAGADVVVIVAADYDAG